MHQADILMEETAQPALYSEEVRDFVERLITHAGFPTSAREAFAFYEKIIAVFDHLNEPELI